MNFVHLVSRLGRRKTDQGALFASEFQNCSPPSLKNQHSRLFNHGLTQKRLHQRITTQPSRPRLDASTIQSFESELDHHAFVAHGTDLSPLFFWKVVWDGYADGVAGGVDGSCGVESLRLWEGEGLDRHPCDIFAIVIVGIVRGDGSGGGRIRNRRRRGTKVYLSSCWCIVAHRSTAIA